MTVTTHVKARAHGALITLANIAEGEVGHVTDTEEIVLAGWEERQFHLEDGQQLTVKQGTPKMMEDLAAATAEKTPADPPATDPALDGDPSANPGDFDGLKKVVLTDDPSPVIEEEKVADDAGRSRGGRR